MTKREKIRILKAMLPLIDTVYRWRGLCLVKNVSLELYSFTVDLESLGLSRPKRKYYSVWWYPRTKKGDNQRRAAIRRAIKKLQAK